MMLESRRLNDDNYDDSLSISNHLRVPFTFKALHDQAPVYLMRRCIRVSSDAGRARLRSAFSGQLVVPRTSEKTFGDRAFACSGPISWKCLSSLVRDDCLSLHSFKKLLKTALFQLAAFAEYTVNFEILTQTSFSVALM